MKIYCSLPMTNATDEDRRLITETRRRLRAEFPRLEVFYPDLKDETGLDMAAIQDLDFSEISQSDGCLSIWGPTADRSAGMAAEIEWCRRVFHIPVVIYQPGSTAAPIPKWIVTSAQRRVRRDLCEAVRLLMEWRTTDAYERSAPAVFGVCNAQGRSGGKG